MTTAKMSTAAQTLQILYILPILYIIIPFILLYLLLYILSPYTISPLSFPLPLTYTTTTTTTLFYPHLFPPSQLSFPPIPSTPSNTLYPNLYLQSLKHTPHPLYPLHILSPTNLLPTLHPNNYIFVFHLPSIPTFLTPSISQPNAWLACRGCEIVS